MREGSQKRVEKPWGHEIWWAQTEHYAAKILAVEKGHALSLQFHREKDETSYLLSGRLRLTAGASEAELETQVIEPGSSWRNEPGRSVRLRLWRTPSSLRFRPHSSMTSSASAIGMAALDRDSGP